MDSIQEKISLVVHNKFSSKIKLDILEKIDWKLNVKICAELWSELYSELDSEIYQMITNG